jgi:hypothetical protein
VAKTGRECRERAFLEFHHVRPYAVGGEATVENIALRCRAHNKYEADLFYGTGLPATPEQAMVGRTEGEPELGPDRVAAQPQEPSGDSHRFDAVTTDIVPAL